MLHHTDCMWKQHLNLPVRDTYSLNYLRAPIFTLSNIFIDINIYNDNGFAFYTIESHEDKVRIFFSTCFSGEKGYKEDD